MTKNKFMNRSTSREKEKEVKVTFERDTTLVDENVNAYTLCKTCNVHASHTTSLNHAFKRIKQLLCGKS